MTIKPGYTSNLRQLVDNLERKLGQKVSQGDLAERAGVSEGTFSSWMKHYKVNRALNFDSWFGIARALNVHPYDLIELVGVDWLEKKGEEETPEVIELQLAS
jgi:DNA-binding Xre family transcriptional regulator